MKKTDNNKKNVNGKLDSKKNSLNKSEKQEQKRQNKLNKINNNKDNHRNEQKKKIYIGYSSRIIIYIVMFIVFVLLGFIFSFNALDFIEKNVINYSEKSNLDYKVYLKENDFYEEEYLEKNMVYVASLIDKIKINFDYNFISDKDVGLTFNYKVMANLLITDSNGNNTYFKKDYLLLENKNTRLKNNNDINDAIEIDYDYYNSIANNFKNSYGIDAVSNLFVYILINKENINENMLINNNSLMSITIPLSEKSINISIDYKEIDNSSKLIDESSIIIDNIIYMIIAIIMFVLSLVMVVKIVRILTLLKTNKSVYDKYVSRLLNEYDRLVVETTTFPTIEDNNVIKVSKFEELLDVRDNLKLPIMYYLVAKHQKCYFYIMHENKLYLNIVKAVDLEKNNKQ